MLSEALDEERGMAMDFQRLLLTFSRIVMDLQDLFVSIDLNPIKCNAAKCVIADARIMLRKSSP